MPYKTLCTNRNGNYVIALNGSPDAGSYGVWRLLLRSRNLRRHYTQNRPCESAANRPRLMRTERITTVE
jgi:hypothetical protein